MTIPLRTALAAAIDDHCGGILGDEADAADGIIKALGEQGWRVVPAEPSPGVLMSMAVRADHALGMPGYYDQPALAAIGVSPHARHLDAALVAARQAYEEAVGLGFYTPEKEAGYCALLNGEAGAACIRDMLPGDLVAHPFDEHPDGDGIIYAIAGTPIWVSAGRNRYTAWPPAYLRRESEIYQFEVKAGSPTELIRLVEETLASRRGKA